MTRKISQKQLKSLEAQGATVKRAMGGEKPKAKATPPPAPEPKAEVPMASMSASMQHLETQADAAMQVIAHNTLVIDKFKDELEKMAERVSKRVPYSFDIKRDSNKLLERIIATPMLD